MEEIGLKSVVKKTHTINKKFDALEMDRILIDRSIENWSWIGDTIHPKVFDSWFNIFLD